MLLALKSYKSVGIVSIARRDDNTELVKSADFFADCCWKRIKKRPGVKTGPFVSLPGLNTL